MGIDKRATLPPPLPPVHVTKIVKIYLYRLCMFICIDFRGLWADNLYLSSCKSCSFREVTHVTILCHTRHERQYL